MLYDLLIIGAGVNGAGIARDAAGRGLKVALVDSGDIGGATSSASTKLLHGGLRYLEFYEFALVRKALQERELLLDLMPHISWPQSFVLPLAEGMRPGWMIHAGLLLYDRLARRRQVPASRRVTLRDDRAGQPLQSRFSRAFRYWDGWVDDARLVIANARDAAARGADVRPRTAVTAARIEQGAWTATLADGSELRAAHLVNCAGPWAERVARDLLGLHDAPRLRLVQGAHLVTRRVGSGEDGYMLQQPDGRIVFLLPYERHFSLIGTTDTPVAEPGRAAITAQERDYLLAAVNRYLARPVQTSDIVHEFAGIRPLVLEDGKSARETTRDWKLVAHAGAPATTVVGGKITTYRRLAEAVLKQISPRSQPWTASAPLPGGDVPRGAGETGQQAFARWRAGLMARYADYDPAIVRRLAHLYGTEAEPMLAQGLGLNLGGIFTAELEHMVYREWARTADDILWRRSKLGLVLDAPARARVEDWMQREHV